MSVYIYQIGRLEKNIDKKIRYKIEDKEVEAYLSSFAFKEFLQDQGKNVKVKLLFPVSLLKKFSEVEIESLEKVRNEVKEIISDDEKLNKLMRNYDKLKGIFSHHPYIKEAGFNIIPSVGKYDNLTFNSEFEDIVLHIFLDLMETYLSDRFSEIYIDISTGQNIYVTALFEASRYFLTFYRLSDFSNKNLNIFIMYSDPIEGNPEKKIFSIHYSYKMESKAFFEIKKESGEKFDEYINNFMSKLFPNREVRKIIRNHVVKFLVNGYLFYSAIKNNTPLAIYTFKLNSEEEINESLQEFTRTLREILSSQSICNSSGIKFGDIWKIYTVLAIYKGIVNLVRKLGIEQNGEVDIESLKKDFEKIYKEILAMAHNYEYLSHEIENNFKKESNKFNENYDCLAKYLVYNGECLENPQISNIDPRHFFAHCGFEKSITLVKKENEKIYVKYNEKSLERVKELLLKG